MDEFDNQYEKNEDVDRGEFTSDEMYGSQDNNETETNNNPYSGAYQQPIYNQNERKVEEKPNKEKSTIKVWLAIIIIIAAAITGGLVTLAVRNVLPEIKFTLPKFTQGPSGENNASPKPSHSPNPSVTLGSVDKTIIDASNPVVSIAEQVGPRVVTVRNKQIIINQGIFGNTNSSKPVDVGGGAGVVVSKDGYIVTNNHVVEGADEVAVVFNDSEEEFIATIVGVDPHTDLAVLKIDKNDLTPIEFANADEIRVGELAVAIGNPLGSTGAVTTGIVSAKNRKTYITDYNYIDMLQTDAAINPGNSGGALVNARGQLIGICTMKTMYTSGENGQVVNAEGVGYAIPVDTVEQIIERIIKEGKIVRAELGINCSYTEGDPAKNIPAGIYVASVTRGAAASNAGIRPGDIIVKVEDQPATSIEMMKGFIEQRKPGDILNLTIRRESGQMVDIRVELTELKD